MLQCEDCGLGKGIADDLRAKVFEEGFIHSESRDTGIELSSFRRS
jgi:hypothetical protein